MKEKSSLNWQVLDLLNDLIVERGISKTELAQNAGIGRNTLFTKLRGETALTTDDIAALAAALGADPELILRKAWEGRMSAHTTNVVVGRFGQTDEPYETREVAHPATDDDGEENHD